MQYEKKSWKKKKLTYRIEYYTFYYKDNLEEIVVVSSNIEFI